MTDTMPFSFEVIPDEVLLERAPLVRVLFQARFAPVPELLDDALERALAERLTPYPVRGSTTALMMALPGGPDPKVEHLRTFEDEDGAWKVTLGQDFIAFETASYERRDPFVERLSEVLHALAAVRAPARVNRVGLRYIDRIEEPSGLVGLVSPALLGWLGHLADPEQVLEHQIVQAQLKVPDSPDRVGVRSLFLPPGLMVDPSIPPANERSWWLDIDAFDETTGRFDADILSEKASALARHAYAIFHWSVTDDFRRHFGVIDQENDLV